MSDRDLDLVDALGTMNLLLNRAEVVLSDLMEGYFSVSPRMSAPDKRLLILCDYEKSGRKVEIAFDYLRQVQQLVEDTMEKAESESA